MMRPANGDILLIAYYALFVLFIVFACVNGS